MVMVHIAALIMLSSCSPQQPITLTICGGSWWYDNSRKLCKVSYAGEFDCEEHGPYAVLDRQYRECQVLSLARQGRHPEP